MKVDIPTQAVSGLLKAELSQNSEPFCKALPDRKPNLWKLHRSAVPEES